MAGYVFTIIIVFLVLVLLLSGIMHDIAHRKAVYERIRSTFGSSSDSSFDTKVFDRLPAMYTYMTGKDPDDFTLDDITESDLSLRDIFARMNRCATNAGEEYMYCRFRTFSPEPFKLYDEITKYADDSESAVDLLYILETYIGKHDYDGFAVIQSMQGAKRQSVVSDIVSLILLVISVVLIAASPVIGITATVIMVCVSVWGYFRGRRSMDENLKGFALAQRLIRCSQKLSQSGCDNFAQYKELTGILRGGFLISGKDQTSSSPVSIILDYVRMITHIDIIVFKLKISRLIGHIDLLESLYIDTGRLDCILAVSSYIRERRYCRAVISDDKIIKASQIYHPLVPKPVYNDFRAGRGVLITGSNASGKSTFLKAVAVNVLFARSFGFAFADAFETGKFKIYTSMALADNLLGSESYYVVEARSIKRMCDIAASDCLFIIDEVLKGTNTVERIAAGANILKYLCDRSAMCFAATHDLELTYLLEDRMDLYHFTEEISEDTVTFPFIITPGVSDRTNAIRLLAMLGFDATIVSGADELVGQYNTTGNWIR